MTAGWVAGSVRARAMARRRYGAAAARTLAASRSLADALDLLAGTSYGRDVRPGQGLAAAQHALGATVLWHLRVLAGWMPRQGTDVLRVLAGGFEIANVDGLLDTLTEPAADRPAPYRLGTLATAWPRLAAEQTVTGIRAVLAASPWGDPEVDSGWAVRAGMRLSWARRATGIIPDAVPWAAGAAALLLARETFLAGRRLPGPLRQFAAAVLGSRAVEASSYGDLARGLPATAAWVLDGTGDPADLWRAEARWWRRVEDDGFALLHRGRFDSAPLVGAAAVLGADAWRVRAALEVAARGGAGLEVFDVLA